MGSADNEWAVESPPLRTPNHELQALEDLDMIEAVDATTKITQRKEASTYITRFERPFARRTDVRTDTLPSPLVERVKTKLTGWSWEMEKAEEEDDESPMQPYSRKHFASQGKPRSLSGGVHVPSPPPNTQHHSRQSSSRHSIPQSSDADEEYTSHGDDLQSDGHAGTPEDFGFDHEDEDEDEEKDDDEAELSMTELEQSTEQEHGEIDTISQAHRTSRPGMGPPRSSCPAFASASRRFSNLTGEEAHFQAHRNSVDLARERKHMQDLAGKLNQSLMNARDSFVVTKSKLGTRPPVSSPSSSSNLERLGQHTSSVEREPSMRVQNLSAFLAMNTSAAAKLAEPPKTVRHSSEEHDDCPICETDRPEWTRSKHKKKM
jgi:hypothetical protein